MKLPDRVNDDHEIIYLHILLNEAMWTENHPFSSILGISGHLNQILSHAHPGNAHRQFGNVNVAC